MLKFENNSNGRYYYLYVETDLFNSHVLVVMRGGASRPVRIVRVVAGTMDTVNRKIQEITKTRIRRGYTLLMD